MITMNIKNYIGTVAFLIIIGGLSYYLTKDVDVERIKTWFSITGWLSAIVFIVTMVYNPKYEAMGKPDKVLLGDKLIVNQEKHRFEYEEKNGETYGKPSGYGINIPNILGLVIAVIFIVVSLLL